MGGGVWSVCWLGVCFGERMSGARTLLRFTTFAPKATLAGSIAGERVSLKAMHRPPSEITACLWHSFQSRFCQAQMLSPHKSITIENATMATTVAVTNPPMAPDHRMANTVSPRRFARKTAIETSATKKPPRTTTEALENHQSSEVIMNWSFAICWHGILSVPSR